MPVLSSSLRKVVIGLSTAAVMLTALLGAPAAANADDSNVLSGTVTGYGNVILTDGVEVDILNTDGSVYGSVEASTTDGTWTTDPIPDGDYRVKFLPVSSHYRADTLPTITLPADSSVTSALNDTLDNKGAATGKVVDSNGDGIAGVTVSVLLPPADSVVATGTTDADGNYLVWVDNANHSDNPTYLISYASSDGNYQQQFSGGVSNLNDAAGVSIVDDQGDQDQITLPDATSVTGTITDSNNNPIAGATVSAYDPNGVFPNSADVTTDSDGNYRIGGLGATDYNLNVTAPAYFYQGGTLDADLTTATTTTTNAELAENGDIQGTITDAQGNPVSNVDVNVVDSTGTAVSGGQPDADGHYLVNGLPFGTYTVDFSEDPDTHGYTEDVSGTVNITKTNYDATLDHVMHVGGAISGTITTLNDSSHSPEEVIVTAQSTTSSFSKYVFVTPTTGLTSTYTLDGLPADTYKVEFDPQDDNTFASQWWKSSYSADTATVVAVATGVNVPNINDTVQKVVQPADLYAAPNSDHVDVGTKLSVATHTHSVSVPSKLTSTYQWVRIADDEEGTQTPIAKATKSTYTTANADAGFSIGVYVTQTAKGYAPWTSFLVDENGIVGNAIFTSVPKLALSGTASTGHTLTVTSKGSFSVPVTLAYYWNMNGLPVPAAWSTRVDPTTEFNASNSMLLGWDDLGRGNPYDTSAGFNPPADWLTTKGDIDVPEDATISDPVGPNDHNYPFDFTKLLHPQWNHQRLSVQVCASAPLYKDYCKTFKVTVAKDLAKRVIPLPTLSNGVYTANAGVWHSSLWTKGTVKLKYQWFRDGVAIAKATSSKYATVAADSGHVITVHVTGSASGYTSATTYSLNTTPLS